MSRRRQLNGITHGLLGSFMGRNNDVDGYWALGKLYLDANAVGTSRVEIELLSGTDTDSRSAIEKVRRRYKEQLDLHLERLGFQPTVLKSATIFVGFNTLDQVSYYTRGEPFVCIVKIEDDQDRIYSASAVGRCAVHDPRVDRQRYDQI